MKYIVYKTINLVNDRYYIGKHGQNRSEFDGYLGSGTVLASAIAKYGRENFDRITLYETDSELDCYAQEQKILKEALLDPACYNMMHGGLGFSSGELHPMYGTTRTADTKSKISANNKRGMLGKSHSEQAKAAIGAASQNRKVSDDTRRKMSEAAKRRPPMSDQTKRKLREKNSGVNAANYGKRFSNEHKRKMSLAQTGKRNSKFQGYFVTPWGKFESALGASKALGISDNAIKSWCKKNDRILTKQTFGNMKVKLFEEADIGKTYAELGFNFIPINSRIEQEQK